MKTGIMGGTFNPPHLAHLTCAREAMTACSLERVWFVPANDPPHKALAGEISFAERCEMVRLAIAGIPDFELSTIESERHGKSYSVDLLSLLTERHPHERFFFIIGSDSFLELSLWHRYADLVRLCDLIVMQRPGRDVADPHRSLPVAIRNEFRYNSETRQLEHSSGKQIIFLTGMPQDISSTGIRSEVAAGHSISTFVPPSVEAYIITQRMYTE